MDARESRQFSQKGGDREGYTAHVTFA